LPHTLPLFDRVLVVTSEKDYETQETCRRLSCPYYATNIMYKDGDVFNKARAIDFAIGYTRYNEWMVQLDADMYLPPMTRKWLEWRTMDEECIYGIDRVHCVGYENWKKFEKDSDYYIQFDYMCRIHIPKQFPVLDRIAIRDYGGYIPIGFFQMWHCKHGRRYPIALGSAEHTDVLHSIQWGENKRVLIPEIVGTHVTPVMMPLGSNWKGRDKMPRFGPGPLVPYVNKGPITRNGKENPKLYNG
jgi:hypothetical protein